MSSDVRRDAQRAALDLQTTSLIFSNTEYDIFLSQYQRNLAHGASCRQIGSSESGIGLEVQRQVPQHSHEEYSMSLRHLVNRRNCISGLAYAEEKSEKRSSRGGSKRTLPLAFAGSYYRFSSSSSSKPFSSPFSGTNISPRENRSAKPGRRGGGGTSREDLGVLLAMLRASCQEIVFRIGDFFSSFQLKFTMAPS